MQDERLQKIAEKFSNETPESYSEGLELSKSLVKDGYYSDEFLELLTSVFFTDVYEYNELRDSVEEIAGLIGKLGEQALPRLLELVDDADAKASFYFAVSIGAIGVPAIQPVVQKLISTEDSFIRALLIFSLGKIKDPAIKRVIPDLQPFLSDSDSEVRDSAVRTLGKIFEIAEPDDISEQEVELVFVKFMDLLKDTDSKVRAKAMHSLGKLVSKGYLTNLQIQKLESSVLKILGKDKNYNWDNAYIVRREARPVYDMIKEYFKK